MDFMSNVLPSAVDRWNISNGSMTEKRLLLHPGGSAICTLEKTELAYIPQAFQVRLRHNANIDWKKPRLFATIDIEYDDEKTLQALIPFNTTSVTQTGNITTNVVIVDSKPYANFTFSITNTLDADLILTLYELRPSLDLDESLYNSIEGMLPQLVYAYNDSAVTAQTGVDTQVVQLPVSVKQDANLLLHLSITGQTTGDTLSCTVRIDGETVKSFPVRQTTSSGEFYFGVPSLLAFVKKGPHIVTVQIKANNSTVTVPKEGALIVLDGKGILGGASGEYPHAEVSQEILLSGMYNNFAQDVLITELDSDVHVFSTNIPLSMNNIATAIALEVVRRGDIIDFASLDGSAPPLTPYDSSVYYTNMYGMKSIVTATYNYTKEVKEDCTIITTVVDTSKFNPIHTRTLTEEVND